MLKTYRIIPLVFILFLFGFTLIPVATVIAEDSPEFVACQQIKPSGDFRLMKQKKNCFRDVAKRLGAKKREGAFGACQRIKPNRVSTQKMQQKIDCFMDVASSLMPNTAPPAGATGMPPTMAAPPAVPVESSVGAADLSCYVQVCAGIGGCGDMKIDCDTCTRFGGAEGKCKYVERNPTPPVAPVESSVGAADQKCYLRASGGFVSVDQEIDCDTCTRFGGTANHGDGSVKGRRCNAAGKGSGEAWDKRWEKTGKCGEGWGSESRERCQ